MSKSREAKTISVFLRIRPPNSGEKERNEKCDVVKTDDATPGVVTLASVPNTPYKFSNVFKGDSKQEDVFELAAKQAVVDAFDGYHGLLFVYGQTGTGKTFTISNQAEGQEGMLQRAIDLVFSKISEDASGEYEVACSFIQVYQENIQDLLKDSGEAAPPKGIQIRDDPEVEGGVYLSPLRIEPCYDKSSTGPEGVKKALKMFHKGDSNRSVGATNMNAVSSRSHTVFTLYITRRNKMTESDYDSDSGDKQTIKGRLILVDLAGCERQKKTGASDQRLNEANSINSSLLVLGKCINSLTEPGKFVPYRESKLTRLLQYSLAGHGKTTIVVTCGPSERNLDETRSAIEFGQRAMNIKVQAKKHVEIDYKALCKQLQAQLDARGDAANQQLIKEVKAECAEEIAKKNDIIRELEARLGIPPEKSSVGIGTEPGGVTARGTSPDDGVSGKAKWWHCCVPAKKKTNQIAPA